MIKKNKIFKIKLSKEADIINSLEIYNEELNDKTEYILGIDEAGRGPILGYMVYAGLLLKQTDKTYYKDSKKLSETQRNEMFKEIKENKIYFIFKISAKIISETMLSNNNENLDDLARFAIINIIKRASKFKLKYIYIDKIGRDGFDKYLLKKFRIPLSIEPKADDKYQCVSGASIVAKVTRDSYLSKEMGSGYPSDPITKKYLRDTFCNIMGWDDNIRYSWATAKRFFINKTNKIKLYSFDTIFL